MTPRTLKAVSLAVGLAGLVLLLMMITVEGEFGALPLALLVLAAGGYITGRMRKRRSSS